MCAIVNNNREVDAASQLVGATANRQHLINERNLLTSPLNDANVRMNTEHVGI
jgi:hypothetical protein